MAGIYDERILGAKQQAETARKLREGIISPEGQMVSGYYVAPSWTQYLSNALRQGMYGRQEREAIQQAGQIEQQKAAEIDAINKQLAPQAQSTVSDVGPQQPVRMPTQQEKMAALLRGVSVAPEQFTPQLQAEEWQQGMQDKQQAREDAMQARKEQLTMAAQQRKDQMEFQANQAALARQQNFENQQAMARLGAQLRPQQEKMIAVMGKDGNPIMVPQSQATGMTPYNAQTMKGEGTAQQRASDAAESNALLSQVEQVGNTATSSGIGRLRDTAAGFVGMSTPGADAAAKMKVLGASLTAKVPKMSGPQSDKDVAMYKEAAGNIADPTIPWSQKQAAINTIREINNRQIQYARDGIPQQPSVPESGGQIKRYNPSTGRIE